MSVSSYAGLASPTEHRPLSMRGGLTIHPPPCSPRAKQTSGRLRPSMPLGKPYVGVVSSWTRPVGLFVGTCTHATSDPRQGIEPDHVAQGRVLIDQFPNA